MEGLIARLYPYGEGEDGYATRTVEKLENSSLMVEVKKDLPELYGRNSRESTAPLSDVEDEGMKETVGGKGLQLTFTHGSKAGPGLLLGTDKNTCDILLPLMKGVSRCHCYLTFDKERRLILRDCSTNGTLVTHDGKGGKKRRHFTWILGGHEVPDKTETIVIQLHAALRFQMVVAKPTFPHIYYENIDDFLRETAATTDLQFGALGIQSIASTAAPSGTHTPNQEPILLEQETLSRGAYGVVTRVWDVSKGREYASKRFTDLRESDRVHTTELSLTACARILKSLIPEGALQQFAT
ncbi:Protein kinase protein rad53 [Friedmanniomyces endolithicus]|uniref:Protein kinase protein rad53 n=1 Tax=Friedmanniomyces endolithicus TaxID=329885 RepID=A0AAN6H5F3_9PEZI|nr:Protein kinase protein rad53 [Friedmanniomyces endolithicus]KAK0953418.1 Protein kinase protein rad53 [Friedmanniomyces endolithicus]KAK1023397.1 Protein kinase protein rad53 [Friedmanniomyces endolithicus]